ncbi:PocR ligand-binding domain-containing protein [Desulfopila sp. IMCC35008]|uniref:PocR ligand-binding domain-containing protein n=1 Tax=Desulfopila sp. IMCC35008 TaxID=2653858 RepID=UPI0013CF4FA9|nr:PocR ligand-binding domain-containing protein [Desulfopila sp. IMCC35008]
MQKNIAQLLDRSKLQALFQSMYDATGIPSALVDTDGEILTQAGWQTVCLEFHRKNPQTLTLCRQSDLFIKEKLDKGEDNIIYECPLGLIDSCCPVTVDGEHFASVFTGQFFHASLTEKDLERFRLQARKYGFNEADYLAAIKQVPIIPPDKHNKILSFLTMLAEMIMEMANQSITISTSEKKFRDTLGAINDGIWEWNLKNESLRVNSRCLQMLDYPSQSATFDAETFALMIHPRERKGVLKGLKAAVQDMVYFEHEFRLRKADRSYLWVLGRGRAILEPGEQEPSIILGTLSDITDKIGLKQSFEKAFDSSPLLMTLSEISSGKYINANTTFFDVTGYDKKSVIGTTSIDLGFISTEDRSRLIAILKEQGKVENLRLRLKKADGEDIFCDYTGVVIVVNGEKQLLSLAVDVTNQLSTERAKADMNRQLRQAQKMEAIGSLAGGIAHDFNNILSAMLGYTDMAMEDVVRESRTWHDLNNVMRAGSRAKDLVGQILTFSRQSETVKTHLDLLTVLKEVIKLLRSTLPTTIAIVQDITIAEGAVYADPVQIHQVIMNLCTNAYHAMQEDGGTLNISLGKCSQPPGWIMRDASRRKTQFLQLSVTDTGRGIEPSHLDRIFDPFFTTKEEGIGTGMGLSIVYGIMADLGGAVTVESAVDEGTTFHLFLPETVGQGKDNEAEGILPGGRETIMIIDDEELLVKMTKSQLERLGYRVLGTCGAFEALELFEGSPGLIDLVITDYTMPDLTGLEVAKRILDLRPDMPIVLCTGFSENIDEESACRQGIKKFLFKPVLKKDLAVSVRELLDA